MIPQRARGAVRRASLLLAVAVALPAAAAAQTVSAAGLSDEERTARFFDEIRADPPRVLMFLRTMPKGADLHSHLSGAIYAETYIRWAAEDGLCIELAAGAFARPPCDAGAGRPPAAEALHDAGLHDRVVDALSMRNWHPSRGTGHEQFFGSFDRFRLVSNRTGEMLAEVSARAADGGVSYLELMLTPEAGAAAGLARGIDTPDDFDALRDQLLRAGLRDTLERGRRRIDEAESRRREVLGCDGTAPAAGCEVVVRYQYQALRARAPAQVFAHLLAGFELVAADARFVGINFVQPEDHVVAMRDYALHMRMIEALRRHYPGVRLTLHAGELAARLVPPDALRWHIREAVERGGASRIGHGTSIAHEHDADGLLREMARRGVLVEIALGSNDAILGTRGAHHPLRLYMSYGVPVALVTDDEGVLRSEMTMEYMKAVEEHGLGYIELKQLARNSLEHAFVEGASLWADAAAARPVPQCAAGLDTAPCEAFVGDSTRALLQRELERAFVRLEARYAASWTSR
jgi:adenosine deaminase